MMKYTFPAGYGTRCILVPIDAALVPLIAGSLRKFFEAGVWESRADYEAGYNAFGELYAAMVNNCATELIEGQKRLYRLIDSIYNGTAYTAPTADPADITPAIPLVPPATPPAAPGLRRQLLDAQGELPDGFLGLFPRPATTADLVKAVRQGSEEQATSLIDRLDLLGDAGDLAGIFNVVRGTIGQGVELATEGGVLATLVISTMAQAATAGLAAAQMDTVLARLERIIEQLGVVAAPAPQNTIGGELAQVRELLSPEPYSPAED